VSWLQELRLALRVLRATPVELSIRAALHASRWRLARQSLVESLVLSPNGCGRRSPLRAVGHSGVAAAVVDLGQSRRDTWAPHTPPSIPRHVCRCSCAC